MIHTHTWVTNKLSNLPQVKLFSQALKTNSLRYSLFSFLSVREERWRTSKLIGLQRLPEPCDWFKLIYYVLIGPLYNEITIVKLKERKSPSETIWVFEIISFLLNIPQRFKWADGRELKLWVEVVLANYKLKYVQET